jgi:uncharacterized protein involved in exopolysaccharide biosynthesis
MENTGTKNSVRYDLRSLTLRDLAGPLFRNWRAVLLTFCAILGMAILVAWKWADNYYVASMQVVVSRERTNPKVTGEQNAAVEENGSGVTSDDVVSEIALLQGRDLLEQVVRTCHLTKPDSTVHASVLKPVSANVDPIEPGELESATNALAAKLRVEAQKASRIIDLKYGASGPPETPACVLQTLGNVYMAKHLKLQRPAGTFDFFAAETEKYQQALEQSELRLANFSKTEGVAAPDLMRTDMAQQLVEARSKLYDAKQAIAANLHRLENLKKQMIETPSRSSTVETSESANFLLEQLQSSLLAAQVKKIQLLTKYDPSFPLVQEAEAEIEATKNAISEAETAKYVNTTTDRDPTFEYLRQDQAKTEADLATEEAAVAELINTIHGVQSEMVSMDGKTVKQGVLLREAKANETNYLLYLTKREQERTSDALDEKRIANVAIAVPAEVPALPARSPISVLIPGFLLAVLGGIGAGYLAELVDASFRTPAEIEELLDISVLAAYPKRAR